jgi:tellurite resistance-related uncharacterized protein
VFDETTLPAALRGEHRTKAGVWGVIRVIEGQVALRFVDQDAELVLSPGSPGFILPDQPHSVAPLGRMRMQVDFYNEPPDGEQGCGAVGV